MNEEQQVNKMRTSDTGLNSIEWRLSNIEKHHQIRKLSSDDGKTYFDTENNVIIINDGTNDRVIIGDLG